MILRFWPEWVAQAGGRMPWIQHILGLPCPFCGVTRGTQALVRGDFGRAWYFNPAVVLLVPSAVGAALVMAVEVWCGRVWVPWMGWVNAVFRQWSWLLAAVFLYWLLHLGLALWLPKPELFHPEAPLFPGRWFGF